MAADDDQKEDVKEDDAWKRSNRLLIIILSSIFGLILVGGGSAGLVYYLLSGNTVSEKGKKKAKKVSKKNSVKAKVDEEDDKPKVAKKPAKYFKIKPPFMVKIKSRSGKGSFMQADITIMTRSDSVLKDLAQHEPLIKNDILTLLTNTRREDVMKVEGKLRLQKKALDTINKILADQGNKERAVAVLFTNFVVQ